VPKWTKLKEEQMSTSRARISRSVFLGVFLIVGQLTVMPAFAAANPSATGGGTAEEGGETSTFTFNAIQHETGTVNGHLVYHVRIFDITFHMGIDCLRIHGKRAALSGTVTKVSGNTDDFPFIYVGQDGVFVVEDNGEGGSGAPDLISDVDLDPGLDCKSSLLFPYIPISGNVQVSP
jgi:hypothetical protein